ncbi:JAB domain-containing protein [Pedobacter aquatilis]|uniref:JAB domain-containing protein n=1 Tax=Pedobacter aquatilis TaxID=351343 RepID=UPI00292E6EF5|nr:JAB domain-containing protein [Pedobacter aquatilis]
METMQFKVSEIQVSYHPRFKAGERPKVTSSIEAYSILRQGWDEDRMELLEEFKVLLLNRPNRVLGVMLVASGGLAGVMVDPKLVFSVALKCGAHGMILAHNHPSGELMPSSADISLTTKLKAGGKLLGIEVFDHLILSPDGYYSFGDEGMMAV